MSKKQIGFLHPGAMGISLAVSAQNSGHEAYWVSEGRSRETIERAAEHNLIELKTLEELCDKCSVIISVCPPHAATDLAEQVLKHSFEGIYVDANAISPQRAKDIGDLMDQAGVAYVDGGIIGGPAWKASSTWLYLSGSNAEEVVSCFTEGPLETEIMGDEIGRASALKMCFAANSKGTTALLCGIVAAAEEMGVRKELEKQWSRYDPKFAKETLARVSRVTAKAWRFSGEMKEIASTFEAAGLPDGFHLAAYEIYDRISKFKGDESPPPVEEVLEALLNPDKPK
ncbi:MAG: NAD(P)-dependent oxidoreductase [Anaerolineales bacterium]|uniref:NAD(P)-dependent oxidoreductase n=1 Tax=Candidatus Desulfolinea nitratireducens TaxID=2841698 RepID=A0A8J6NKB9_9CHLR|nr:NAD(P)-dependent oxidoreductase [Candidatus Desulfolinea nitratireducens]